MPLTLEAMLDKRSWLLDRARYLCGTRTDAEDLVQETFLRFTVLGACDSARSPERSSASWLLSTMTHCFYDQCRRRQVRDRNTADPLLGPGVEESPDAVEPELWDLVTPQDLRWAIQKLGGPGRSAVLMYLEGRKNREIARELGISPGAVAKRLHDSRARLRRLLRPMLN